MESLTGHIPSKSSEVRAPLPPGLHHLSVQEVSQQADGDPAGFLLKLGQEFGDIVCFKTVYGLAYFINHPDYIQYILTNSNYVRSGNYPFKLVLGEGLLSSEGEVWRRHRRMIQPKFQKRYLETLSEIMVGSAVALTDRWGTLAESGHTFDMGLEMFDLTMDALIHSMFSGHLIEKADVLRDNIISLIDTIGRLTVIQFAIPLSFSPIQMKIYKESVRVLDEIIYELIAYRRATPSPEADLVALLLDIRDEETGEGLNDEELRNEILTILVAGSETTALTMAWCWYLLSQHPEVEAKLHTELDLVLGGRTPAVDDLAHLPYTRMVLEETLRLYPPLWSIYRQTIDTDEIGGYRIEAKSSLILSSYAIQRHPKFWDSPECFEPERFLPENVSERPKYAYFPFGGGRHLCLGNHLFLMEGQLFLATLAQRFRPRLVAGAKVEGVANVTLRHRDGVPMFVESRL
ncbi:putative cytochrome P450 132 [Abditibacteriota bacterium]|nr:putative cytochrome P450 132 [Abditibacteriota bacterium]